jgi:hypothetical protein
MFFDKKKINMKLKMQIISLLLVSCGAILYGSENIDLDDEKNWPQYSTNEFDYKKVITIKPANSIDVLDSLSQIFFTKDDSPQALSVSNNFFSTGITRTKISKRLVGNNVEVTTETWTTANASYFTLTTLLVLTALTANPNYLSSVSPSGNIPHPINSLRRIGTLGNIGMIATHIGQEHNSGFGYSRVFTFDDFSEIAKQSLIRTFTDPLLITTGVMIAAYYAYKKYLESGKNKDFLV